MAFIIHLMILKKECRFTIHQQKKQLKLVFGTLKVWSKLWSSIQMKKTFLIDLERFMKLFQ